ncbi:transmembrane Fragile-X-F-associated protein [Striga asiatica]|uniref:Transmembrane Fragile-X-F-associated protein n=1 Tax=Striga asiatica TaxID=4170 RepID=A0A5A7QEY2_STRAF|nr:transmembrane Fragile-X-F-associated protein [Striga asiatica]
MAHRERRIISLEISKSPLEIDRVQGGGDNLNQDLIVLHLRNLGSARRIAATALGRRAGADGGRAGEGHRLLIGSRSTAPLLLARRAWIWSSEGLRPRDQRSVASSSWVDIFATLVIPRGRGKRQILVACPIYASWPISVNLKIVFLPLIALEIAILVDNIRMCRALMPGEEENITDEAIWETLPHFWVSISMVFFIAATTFTLLKLCGDVAALGWWDLFINYGVAECFAFLICTKWYNPAIHRRPHLTAASSSSMSFRHLSWNNGFLVSTTEDHQDNRICSLHDIGGHVMKIPFVGFQVMLFMYLEGTPPGAKYIPIPLLFSPLLLLQGAGFLFAIYRLCEKINLLLHDDVDTGSTFRLPASTYDYMGFLRRGSRLKTEKILCRVCFDEHINVVLLPCRHYVLCSSCCEKCKRCPICRVYVEERLLVYDDRTRNARIFQGETSLELQLVEKAKLEWLEFDNIKFGRGLCMEKAAFDENQGIGELAQAAFCFSLSGLESTRLCFFDSSEVANWTNSRDASQMQPMEDILFEIRACLEQGLKMGWERVLQLGY